MCPCYSCQNPPRRSIIGRLFSFVASVALLYAGSLLVSGTLINTGHPVAVEVGELMQVVTFVEPTIDWADSNHMDFVANGVRILSGGLPINRMA